MLHAVYMLAKLGVIHVMDKKPCLVVCVVVSMELVSQYVPRPSN